MARLLPKARDGKNTEVLQSQSHVSDVTMRLEKTFKIFLRKRRSVFSGRTVGDSHLESVRAFRAEDGSVYCFTFGSFNPSTKTPYCGRE